MYLHCVIFLHNIYIYMTVDRRHRFGSIGSVTDSSNTVVGDIDLAVVIGATITTIGPPVMAV